MSNENKTDKPAQTASDKKAAAPLEPAMPAGRAIAHLYLTEGHDFPGEQLTHFPCGAEPSKQGRSFVCNYVAADDHYYVKMYMHGQATGGLRMVPRERVKYATLA